MRTHEMTGILEMLLIQQTDRRLVIDVNEEKPSNMEGCPRSSMLNIDLKDSSPTEFDTQLKKVSIYEAYRLLFLSNVFKSSLFRTGFRLQCRRLAQELSSTFLVFLIQFSVHQRTLSRGS